jgi:protein subunit release factor A
VLDHDDLRIDVYRSTDAGGATERAVRVTHTPSGLIGVSQGGVSPAEDIATAIAQIEAQLSPPTDPLLNSG